MNKNPVNAILENLRINETKSIDLGSGSTAYQYNGKYYIKKGDEKREINAEQYQKLLNRGNTAKTNNKSKSEDIKKDLSKSLGVEVSNETADILNKYGLSNDIKSIKTEDRGMGIGHSLIIHMKDGSIKKPYDGQGSNSSGLYPNELANGIASALIGEDRGVSFMRNARDKKRTRAYTERDKFNTDPNWIKEVDNMNKKADAFDEIRKSLVNDFENQGINNFTKEK